MIASERVPTRGHSSRVEVYLDRRAMRLARTAAAVADGLSRCLSQHSRGGTYVAARSPDRRGVGAATMSRGSWPYIPAQCPGCAYFHTESPPFVDDSGYEILGFCRHPRIAMELFRPQQLQTSEADRCPMFIRRAPSRSGTLTERGDGRSGRPR